MLLDRVVHIANQIKLALSPNGKFELMLFCIHENLASSFGFAKKKGIKGYKMMCYATFRYFRMFQVTLMRSAGNEIIKSFA